MSVRFLLGSAGSGKTYRCLERLRRCEREGRTGIYLVPEQFTYSADRELLAVDDLKGLRHVRVLSFSRLAWWLHERAGLTSPLSIDPAVRPMYLRAVLERLPPEKLGPLAALRTRHGLLEQLGRFIGEVRSHGASDFLDGLRRLEVDTEVSPAVRSKLLALGAVFQDYDSWLRDRNRRDPEEHLHGVLPLIAAESALFAETEVFVDGFLSWTRRESEVLVGLALAGADLEVAFCMEGDRETEGNGNGKGNGGGDGNGNGKRDCPGDRDGGGDGAGKGDANRTGNGNGHGRRLPFRPVERSFERLRNRLGRAGVSVEEIVRLPGEHPVRFVAPEIAELERRLYVLDSDGSGGLAASGHTAAPTPPAPSYGSVDPVVPRANPIGLQSARDPYHEVQTWARAIDRWLRLEGRTLRPEEIAVFVRNVERYRDPIARIFPRFGIDFFLDERRSVLAHPRVRLVLGALDVLLSGWRRTSVVSLLRNPYLAIAPSAVDLLENLSLELGRDFERWYDESDWELYSLPERSRFTGRSGETVQDPVELLDPERQYGEDEQDETEVDESVDLEEFGGVRAPRSASAQPLDVVRRRILRPLRHLERRWEGESWTGDVAVLALGELLSEWVPKAPRLRDADWDRRIDQSLGSLLAELADLWREIPAQPEEVSRSLREGLLALRLGVTPMRQGQVLVADIQRSRVEGIRASIVGGVNEGVFPRTVTDDPILGDRDREALGTLGLSLGPNANERQEEEAYLFYIAMTRSSERILITWCGSETEGGEATPSFLVSEIARIFPAQDLHVVSEGEEDELPPAEVQNRAELGPALLSKLSRIMSSSAAARPGAGGEVQETPPGTRQEAGSTGIGPRPSTREEPGASFVSAWVPSPGTLSPGDFGALWSRVHRTHGLESAARELDQGVMALRSGAYEPLPEHLLAMVFGEQIQSSVSRLQEYASCPFRNFASSVLRLEPRPEARVTPLETGTLAHSALELFLSAETNEALADHVRPDSTSPPHTLDLSAIRERLRIVFSRLESEPSFRAFQVDEASRYRWESTRRSLERYLRLELVRLTRSGYHVSRRELPFGFGDEPALELALPEGRRLLLRGKIDRLDVREEADHRLGLVIDYKRSARTGLPISLERGIDLQLATYLIYVRDRLGLEPVGGLYVPVLPSPQRDEKTDPGSVNDLKVRAHGIFLKEERDQIDGGTGILVERGSEQPLPSRERRDDLLATAETFLRSYAHNQRRGQVAPRPLQTEPSRLPCDRCDFLAVCRYRRNKDPRRRTPLEGMEVLP